MQQENPYSSPQAAAAVPPVNPQNFGGGTTGSEAEHVIQPLIEGKGWMRFVGIMLIIFGALYCLGIITALIGGPMIWMGVLLNQAASSLERNMVSEYRMAMDKVKTYFIISGVLMMVGIAFVVLYFFVAIFAAIANF